MSNPNAPAVAARTPRLLCWLGMVALIGYTIFLARNFSNVAGGADSSGYLNSARLIASGHLTAEERIPPEFGPAEKLHRQQFQPHGFAPFEGNPRLSPTYAVGLPLHFAAAGIIFGWNAGPAVVAIGAALAAVWLCYAVGRQLGLDPWLAAAGGAILASYPVFVFITIQPLSDTLATTWCLAAVAAALRARDRAIWAIACGAALGIAVLVRVTNAILLVPLVVLLGGDARRLGFAILGGIPAALWLGYYNHMLYGGALRSGYVNILEAFGWQYGVPTAIHFTKWIALLLPAPLLVLPWLALTQADFRTRVLLALGLWFGLFFALYALYEISHEVWWDLRFILPATPPLILAALLGVEAIARRGAPDRQPHVRVVSAAVLAAWAIGLGVFWTQKFHLLLTQRYERAYADASIAARAQFPADAVVLAGLHSGALYYYTTFPVMRWEFVNAAEFERFRTLAQEKGRAICALLYDVEEREALQQHCPGRWTQLQALGNIRLWRLETPEPEGTSR